MVADGKVTGGDRYLHTCILACLHTYFKVTGGVRVGGGGVGESGEEGGVVAPGP